MEISYIACSAGCRGNVKNTYYPVEYRIKGIDDLRRLAMKDYALALYRNGHRSNDDFLRANAYPFDVDNTHSDDPEEWIYPEDIGCIVRGVPHMIHFSRNNMKDKVYEGGKTVSARPRFHVIFLGDECTDATKYVALKRKMAERYPCFDPKALDAARFFFGTLKPEVRMCPGTRTLDEFIREQEREDALNEQFLENLPSQHSIIREGSRNATMSHFAGRLLKRLGDTDYAHEQFLIRADSCEPKLGSEELDAIWSSARKFFAKISRSEGYVSPERFGVMQSGWEEPIPFSRFSVTPFPVDALPAALRDYALALSESTQTPVDMAGVCILSIVAACVQGKYRVQGKADWIEPLNLYMVSIAKPSERKSAVEKGALRPVNRYEEEYNRMHAHIVESSKMRRRILERRQKSIEENVAKGKAEESELDDICRQISEFRETKPLQLYVDDITTEKLAAVLEENDGRAALISAEGGIFDTLAGLYGKNVNIDVMLKAYSGDTIRVDRVGREHVSVMDPALTIMLMAQPSVIADVLGNRTFRGRGLVARFLFSNPVTFVGRRDYCSKPVPEETYTAYERCIRDLLTDEANREIITLSPEANRQFLEYATALEPMIEKEYREISDWVGKLVGNILRIAGLLCRASVFRGDDFLVEREPLNISGKTMSDAIRLGNYFLDHAKNVFAVMPENAMVNKAETILNMLLEKNLTEFNRRTAMRNLRVFKTSSDIQPVLDFLEEYGYISQKAQIPVTGKGRQPLPVYDVHPGLTSYYRPSVETFVETSEN